MTKEQFERIPRHIAIIMDGNGRWAQDRSLPRLEGHRQGAEVVREIVRASSQWGVEYLTLYAFSTENWKRPSGEVAGLMDILKTYIRSEIAELHANQVKLNFIGDIKRLPPEVLEVIRESRAHTEKNTGLVLTLALSYGGRDEIVRAVQQLIQDISEGKTQPSQLDEELFQMYLYTHNLPDPDLLIRTGGEYRVSNFLLWQMAYTEIYITETHWPDFNREALAAAIRSYAARRRRFGMTDEQIKAAQEAPDEDKEK